MLGLEIKKYWRDSDFLRNITVLVSGTIVAQLLPVAIQPIIRRLFLPEEFGSFSVYFSIYSIFSIIASLRYELAIILPKKDEDSINLFWLTIFINLFFSFFFLIILVLANKIIVDFLKFPVSYSKWLYFIPLSVFFFNFYQSINYLLIRKKAYKAQSVNKITRRFTEGTMQILFGIIKNPFGLIAGDVFGHLANVLSGIYQLKKINFAFRRISLIKIKQIASEYIEFPKYNFIPALFNTLSLSLPTIIISLYYTKEIVGYFDLTRQILLVPSAFISLSISQVLFQRITEKKNEGLSVKQEILSILFILSFLAILFIIIIQLFGGLIFSLYAGESYRISGHYAKYIVFNFSMQFIVSPLGIALVSLGKIKVVSFWQVFNIILISSLFLLKGLKIDLFLLIYAGVDVIGYSVYLFLILYQIRKYEQGLNKSAIS